MSEQNLTLVTGGTGKTGRRVAQRLVERGVPVRIGSRTGSPRFDWEDRTTWAPALDGAGTVYLAYAPDLAYPGAEPVVAGFADAAVAAGVRRLVLLSGRGEPAAQRCEKLVQERDLESTVVRASMFNQNLSEEAFLLEPVRSGVVAFPGGQVAEAFVDADDIADVAVAALTEAGHAGQVYEVTGPRLLTFAEAVVEISGATGRELRYLPVSPEQYASALVEIGTPAEVAAFLRDLFGSIFDGHNAYLTDGVQRALGRAPRDFADYVQDTAATGVWG